MKKTDRKSQIVNYLFLAGIVALIAGNVVWVLKRDGVPGLQLNAAAPGFVLPVVNPAPHLGDEVDLASLVGKVVVLDFFSTTCRSCRNAFPALESLYRSVDPEEVAVLVIASEPMSAARGRQALEKFLREGSYTVPILQDDDRTFRAYGIASIPTVVLIDRGGKVAKIWSGGVAKAELQGAVEALL